MNQKSIAALMSILLSGTLLAILLTVGCGKKEDAPPQEASEQTSTEKDLSCPPGVVALAGDRQIMRQEVDQRARINLRHAGVDESDPDFQKKLIAARKGATDILVRAYVMQEAATEVIEVSTKELEIELLSWKMRVPSKEAWEEFLKSNNMDEKQFSDVLLKDLRIRKMMDKAATRDVPTPSPEEAQQFYDVNTLVFSWPHRVRYDEIRWPAPPHLPAASREQARAGMEKLLRDLAQNPALFDEMLARQVQANYWGPIGIPLPYQTVKDLPPSIQNSLQVLVQGEISPVIETPEGFSVIRIASLSQSYDSAYNEILESIYGDRCRVNLENWIKRQEQKHKIRICDIEFYRGEISSATANVQSGTR